MLDVSMWVALGTLGAALVAIVKFWMNIGAMNASVERTEKKVNDVADDLTKFKLYVAKEFPSAGDFAALEGRFTEAVEGMREDIRHMRTGMDTLVTTFLNMK